MCYVCNVSLCMKCHVLLCVMCVMTCYVFCLVMCYVWGGVLCDVSLLVTCCYVLLCVMCSVLCIFSHLTEISLDEPHKIRKSVDTVDEVKKMAHVLSLCHSVVTEQEQIDVENETLFDEPLPTTSTRDSFSDTDTESNSGSGSFAETPSGFVYKAASPDEEALVKVITFLIHQIH